VSRKICVFIWVLSLGIAAHGQRVGVVLSGGGSKGIAHVGLLKALEDNDIPIDYIAGTSMGAIIGGLYASGYTPDSIQKLVTSRDFQNWALGVIEEEYNFYYKRLEENASWISLKFTVDSVWQHQLPTNLVSPVQMDFAGMLLMASANTACNNNFDSLFIPFRCVAADIQKKEAVVFRSGQLYPAIRASMTYPFIFRPIRIDDRLLFDGGIYNNFPVDVVKQDFSPDFIIGSAVAMNFPPPTEDNIRSHLENLVVFHTEYSIPEGSGIVVRPNLLQTSVTDFSRAREFVDSGYVATLRQMEAIKSAVSRRVSPEIRNNRRKEFVNNKPPLMVDRIFIRGLNEAQREYVSRMLLPQGKPRPIAEIRSEYFRLIAEEHIELITPSAEYNPNTGYFDLYLDVVPDKDLVVQFGGNVSSTPVNFAFLEAQYRHLGYKAHTALFNAYFGRFYSAARLMGRMDFPTNPPFFLEAAGTFNYFDYFKSTNTFFQDRTPAFLQQNQNFFEGRIGIPARYTGRLLAGFSSGRNRDDYYHTNTFSRTDTTDRTTFQFFSPYILLERNTLNRKQYPNQGTFLSVSLRYVTGLELHTPGSTFPGESRSRRQRDWWMLRSEYENYFTRAERWRLGLYGQVVLTSKPLFSNYTSTMLSAPVFDHVPETRTMFLPNYRANNFGVLGLKGIYSISRSLDFRLEGYVFQPYREIIAQDGFSASYGEPFATRYFMGSSSLVVNTPLGPISLTMNYFDRHEESFSFSFNLGYLIFNRRPFE
jgi:NTE family protein